ncbi:S100 calcium binding protein U [Gadus chalcogrammus]|uniref:S100 calcium binding protein U n=1 Tax=Gadus chalcogrammus TaxID=1042646 RepID=UPI0024C48531|nr:S100 calcium binding protein U [Gadus chalcogrammus]
MEDAIKTVVKVFVKSAKGGDSMGGKDFDNLVKKQLGNVLTDTDSKGALKEMRKGLDENQDGKVSFEEYMTLIGYLANSMSEAKTKEKAEAPKSEAAVTNSAPAQENNSAAVPAAVALVVEPPKVEVKPVEVALPEPVASAVSAAAAAVGVVVEEAEPKESVDGALAAATAAMSVAKGVVKDEDATS